MEVVPRIHLGRLQPVLDRIKIEPALPVIRHPPSRGQIGKGMDTHNETPHSPASAFAGLSESPAEIRLNVGRMLFDADHHLLG